MQNCHCQIIKVNWHSTDNFVYTNSTVQLKTSGDRLIIQKFMLKTKTYECYADEIELVYGE